MRLRLFLLLLTIITLLIFTLFSYTVAKEFWQKIDFDTTVKLQDKLARRFDGIFSYFSLIGSIEITVSLCLILAILFLIRGKWLVFLGWLMIIPASIGEIFGKLILFHPSPPVIFHRSILPTHLPSFYIQTNFSYPSGHMTRTFFIITVLVCLIFFSRLNFFLKFSLIAALLTLAAMMTVTRVYLGEHWLSDTLGGGILGIGVGLFASILILDSKQDKIPSLARGR